MHVAAEDRGILRIGFGADRPDPAWIRDDNHPLIQEACRQLEKYFAGELRQFDLPLDLRGTPFQMRVWAALLAIPYGQTRSYSQLARQIGAPHAARAVGSANHANPIAILVPCHRVIAAGGALAGYGGGLDRKRFLLQLEGGRRSHPVSSPSQELTPRNAGSRFRLRS
jgi:methylated-DNA-[protein]-cysteine S-methyltransferase